jgi:hypothetical protein
MTLRYDIWGPDVLIANHMETHGVPGGITVSETTKAALDRHVTDLMFEKLPAVKVSARNLWWHHRREATCVLSIAFQCGLGAITSRIYPNPSPHPPPLPRFCAR